MTIQLCELGQTLYCPSQKICIPALSDVICLTVHNWTNTGVLMGIIE